MDDGFARTYGVELLLDSTPQIDHAALLKRLRERCGNVEPMDSSQAATFQAYFYLDHLVTYADGKVPAQSFISVSEEAPNPDALEPSLQQSWDWRDARAIVARCRTAITVSDLMASGLPYQERLALFHNTLQAVLEIVPCLAIHWRPSQQIVSPQAYLQSKQGPDPNPLFPALNVRLFNIQHRSPGETLMDTIGLAALGLPDLQCHFRGLEPNDIGRVLFNTGYYIFGNGDVIEDGHTIQGIAPQARWRCQHEEALVPPEREVIDINPGPPFAAGNR